MTVFSRLTALLLLSLVLLGGCSGADSDVALPDLVGKYRVIAAFTDGDDRATHLANAFKSAPGLTERDIAWFVVGSNAILSNQDQVPARDRLEKLHTVDAFQVVLLGKDGKLIASQLGGLNIQALIDALEPAPSPSPAQSAS